MERFGNGCLGADNATHGRCSGRMLWMDYQKDMGFFYTDDECR